MPVAVIAVAQAEEKQDMDSPSPLAEEIKLWVPSELGASEQENGCRDGLAQMEEQLQSAQCADALNELHQKLHTKLHLIHFCNVHVTGQHATGQARGQIAKLGVRINLVADRYRAGRQVLLALQGGIGCEGV